MADSKQDADIMTIVLTIVIAAVLVSLAMYLYERVVAREKSASAPSAAGLPVVHSALA